MNTILNVCAPVINEAMTNCCDVEIVMIVCKTVGVIVLIIAIATCVWHCLSLCALNKMKEQELAIEKEKNNKEKDIKVPEKTNSEKATGLLKELTALVKPKEGDVNKEKLDQMVELYKKLKKDFDDDEAVK